MIARVDGIWVGMVDVRPAAPDGALGDWEGGAYAYCAGRAADLPAFLVRLTAAARAAALELVGIDWLTGHDALPEETRASAAVRDTVAAAVAAGDVAFEHFHGYPDADDPDAARLEAMKAQVEGLAGNWIDGAIDRYDGAFELGPCAFVAELRFDDGPQLGWASLGGDPAALLRRAAAAADERG